MNEQYRGFSTDMLRAVRARDIPQVQSILQAGADPNGISTHELSMNAAGFIRFGPFVSDGSLPDPFLATHSREDALLAVGKPQLSKITDEEIQDRLEDCIARFWSEPLLRFLTQIPQGDIIPAIIAAAETSEIEIVDLLLSAGADISFWTSRATEVPVVATPSSLAVTTPLHAAIWARNLPMLRHLLVKGFDPNIMPLAAPTRCITPAMATIVHCDPWNQTAYEILRQHPKFDINIRTPVYGVHLLHFAVATLSVPLLETIAVDVALSNAGVTALGHTLLHIACLPPDERYIQLHSKAIYSSIHETRNLSELDGIIKARHSDRMTGDYITARDILEEMEIEYLTDAAAPVDSTRLALSIDYYELQTQIMQLLDQHGVIDPSAQDVYGNTALHYLASCRKVNTELLNWLRSEKGAELSWSATKNRYGFTAKELLESGKKASASKEPASFWHDPDTRYRKNQADEAALRKLIENMQYDRLQKRSS